MKFKKVLLPFFAGALAFSLAACSGDDKKEEKNKETTDTEAAIEKTQKELEKQLVKDDQIVAIVNGEEITGEAYNNVLQSLQLELEKSGQDLTTDENIEQLKTATLETLVDQTTVLQQTKAEELEATQAEIDNEYALFITQLGDEKALDKALESEGIDAAVLKELIRESIVFQKYQDQVAPIIDVSEEEIQKYYDDFVAQADGEGESDLPPLEELRVTIITIIQEADQLEKFSAHLKELREAAEVELKL